MSSNHMNRQTRLENRLRRAQRTIVKTKQKLDKALLNELKKHKVISVNDLKTHYALRSDIDKNYISKSNVNKNYLLKSDVNENYLPKSDINKNYVTRFKIHNEIAHMPTQRLMNFKTNCQKIIKNGKNLHY